jgi:hypothetical protein
MIDKTRHSLGDRGYYFLLWGWTAFIGCVGQYIMKVLLHRDDHYLVWLITPVVAVVHIYLLIRDRKKEKVTTYIGQSMSYLWTAIGFSYMTLGFVFAKQGWQYCFPIYILLYAIGTYVSGMLIGFKPMVFGGAACFLLSAAAAYVNFDNSLLITGIALLVSYIIPGHLLQSHSYRNKPVQ